MLLGAKTQLFTLYRFLEQCWVNWHWSKQLPVSPAQDDAHQAVETGLFVLKTGTVQWYGYWLLQASWHCWHRVTPANSLASTDIRQLKQRRAGKTRLTEFRIAAVCDPSRAQNALRACFDTVRCTVVPKARFQGDEGGWHFFCPSVKPFSWTTDRKSLSFLTHHSN